VGEFWNAPFGGAALTLEELRAAQDAITAALDFYGHGRKVLD
jgi:hypothetical protein